MTHENILLSITTSNIRLVFMLRTCQQFRYFELRLQSLTNDTRKYMMWFAWNQIMMQTFTLFCCFTLRLH